LFVQAGEQVEVIHLRNGFVITKQAHDELKTIMRHLISWIDDDRHEARGLKKTERSELEKKRKVQLRDGKVKLVERFMSAIFPGPTADIILISKQCSFTNER
jgi:hypothetical protein